MTERGDKAMSGRQIAVQTTFYSRVSFNKIAKLMENEKDEKYGTRSLLSV